MNNQHSNLRLIALTEENCLSEEETAKLKGNFISDQHYKILINSDADVFKPNGDLLLRYRKNILPREVCLPAYVALRKAAAKAGNRGYAAGFKNEYLAETEGKKTGVRLYQKKQDGTVSNTHRAKPVESGIIGYFNRETRFPYCRQTAFTQNEISKWNAALPFFKAVSNSFETLYPERAAAQREFVERVSNDFVIENTIFTTITVNRNWQTAVHADAGDLRNGFGVLAVFRAGIFSGCFLCFPKYRVAVDIQNFSLLLADVHEYHGNSNFRANGKEIAAGATVPKSIERISCVFYARENMQFCQSAAEENERAKRRLTRANLNSND